MRQLRKYLKKIQQNEDAEVATAMVLIFLAASIIVLLLAVIQSKNEYVINLTKQSEIQEESIQSAMHRMCQQPNCVCETDRYITLVCR